VKKSNEHTEIEKIPCNECRKMIPKGTALTIEGWEKIFYFCDTNCFENWKTKSENNELDNKNGS